MALNETIARSHALCAEGKLEAAWALLQEAVRAQALSSLDYSLLARGVAVLSDRLAASPLIPRLRAAVLGGYTADPISDGLRCVALQEGLLAEVYTAPFAAFRQEILDPASPLHRMTPELVLLAVHARNLSPFPEAFASQQEVEDLVQLHATHFEGLWSALRERWPCKILQHTLEPAGVHYIGPAEHRVPGDGDHFILQLNRALRQKAPPDLFWIDTAGLALRIGLNHWFDPRLYYHGKFGFSPNFLSDYASLLRGALRSMRGRTGKGLVLDLDNTLWGGVVGDAGLEGIDLGPDTPAGEAHHDFCLYLRELRRRGVLLAVNSKNDEATAREVFEQHPHMPLKMDDFAAFVCNWGDKAANLLAIARELNLDPAHLVMADDNPAECQWIQSQLPDVSVICLPEDPAAFIAAVEAGHYFDACLLSDEDRLRANSYTARKQATDLLQKNPDLDSYLQGLEMTAKMTAAGAAEIPRLAQMESKTNQFNVTTRRYTEQQLRDFLADPRRRVLAVQVWDRFAQHGIVSSLVLRREEADLFIESWLMSCRIFSRTLEQYILNELVAWCRGNHVARIFAEYLPTPRNKVIQNLFQTLGFTPDPGGDASRWRLEIPAIRTPLKTFVTTRP